uniref:Uncharacterized protein n=1 Tax=Lotus japonicus TaxID=34305 RepID=I3S0T4_LOTJA|nr:unknown [Lotus japonicus]
MIGVLFLDGMSACSDQTESKPMFASVFLSEASSELIRQ